ncbi:MAG TPA: hypothetical protein VMJ34_23305 [Bryobacteraceae bacterium]|nr:hypothetical protein [Bryobacteraceae bacterium]
MRFRNAFSIVLLLPFLVAGVYAGQPGSRVEYVGGTIQQIPQGCSGRAQTLDEQYFVFYSRGARWRVPYESIDLLEYGQKVDRRYFAAVIISPLFLLAKKREHFLTIGYTDESGKHQAMIFRVNKDDIRGALVTLEARTGRRVEYQDDEARRAGKG